MKEITMFFRANCPHCKKAKEFMEELFAEHPEYKDIPLKMIDELKEPELADKYDYYYVPTYYVGTEKVHEGVPTKEAVENAFASALK